MVMLSTTLYRLYDLTVTGSTGNGPEVTPFSELIGSESGESHDTSVQRNTR